MRKMRRADRQTTPAEAWEILDRADYITLAMAGAEGGPYGVNLSFAREGRSLYFHSAREGYKLDSLRTDPRVCVTAVACQQTLPQEISVAYDSVCGFGTACEVTDEEQRTAALMALIRRYAPENADGPAYCAASGGATSVWRIDLEHITGKRQVKTED